jgi:predicted NBD/HSP70 family sugar kinase
MYAGVDIGGTKTLLAALDDSGVITQKIRFETPKDYDLFVLSLKRAAKELGTIEFHAGGVGMPGKVDEHGRGVWFGNLDWHNVPVHDDIEKILHCPIVAENDAKMAALSEAMLLKDTYRKVLYVTVSTGIGYGLVVDQKIDDALSDRGGKDILVEHQGKLTPWESFASGHAIVERYGKKAQDITDEKTWRAIVRDICRGLIELLAITEPDAVVFGGSVGVYFDRYGKLMREELQKYKTPLVGLPALLGAQRPEEAVLFGCFDLAKQTYGGTRHAHTR